jgi:hypothetical protein
MDELAGGILGAGLRGKIAIVTGVSYRRGIGAAICRAFASGGVDIVFTHGRAYDRQMVYRADEEGPALIERQLREHPCPRSWPTPRRKGRSRPSPSPSLLRLQPKALPSMQSIREGRLHAQ